MRDFLRSKDRIHMAREIRAIKRPILLDWMDELMAMINLSKTYEERKRIFFRWRGEKNKIKLAGLYARRDFLKGVARRSGSLHSKDFYELMKTVEIIAELEAKLKYWSEKC